MEQKDIMYWSDALNTARLKGEPVTQISDKIEDFTRSDAYAIQEEGVKFRLSQGEKIVGLKMGLTSEAKRQQMNLDSPLYGVLTDKMEVQNGGTFYLKRSIHPKIEPEVAFLIDRELSGNIKREDVLQACSAVCGALEILDSRYKHFKYFSMEDVISDNSSSSHFILGPWERNYRTLDLANLSMKMSVNRQLGQEGNSSAISGDPIVSVIQLCELLAERGQTLKAGSIVLAGAATTAVNLEPEMEIGLEVQGLPPLNIQVRN